MKNEERTPLNTSAYCNDKAWWLCDKGHEWEATVSNRSYGQGCPYCSGRLAIPGETDLATLFPEVAKQWHPTRNGDRLPQTTAAYCNDKVLWVCDNGHEWASTVASRGYGHGCPICRGRKRKKQKLV